jgi:hypothetical protein
MKGADRNENSCCQKSESVQRNSENDFRNKEARKYKLNINKELFHGDEEAVFFR